MSMRALVVFSIAFAVAIGGFWAFSTWDKGEFAPKEEQSARQVRDVPQADVSASKVELTHGLNGRLVWKLVAEEAEMGRKAGPVDLSSPVVTYYPEDKSRGEIRISALKGMADPENGSLTMSDNIQAVMDDMKLVADSMVYSGETGKLEFNGGVVLMRQGLSVRAQKAMVDVNRKQVEAVGRVDAVIDSWH